VGSAFRSDAAGLGVRVGVGVAGHHHGELFQGALVRGGQPVPCLITLPACGVGSKARYVPFQPVSVADAEAASMLEVIPAWKEKARRAARLTLGFIGVPAAGRLEIECAVATGVGLGSSTCDVVAAVRAVCNAYGTQIDACDLARLAIEAEGAVDPIMFGGDVVLFAQRHGRVLESFGSWFPSYTVLSIDTDVGGQGIDTLDLPFPAYTDADLAAFENMINKVRQAFRRHDAATIAAVATESATLNQRFLPMRKFQEICVIAKQFGALGIQISHSGTVMGMLFDARSVRMEEGLAMKVTEEVRTLGVRPLGVFRIDAVGGDSLASALMVP
jgi:uncharacterized protein involved in propanediol utilization